MLSAYVLHGSAYPTAVGGFFSCRVFCIARSSYKQSLAEDVIRHSDVLWQDGGQKRNKQARAELEK